MPLPAALARATVRPDGRWHDRWYDWWCGRDVLVRDGAAAAVLTAAAFTPALGAVGVEIADLPVRPADALAVLLVLAQTGPVAVRRRWPAAGLAVTAAGFASYEVLSYPPTVAGWGLYLAVYSAAAHQERGRAATAVAGVVAYAVLAVALSALGSPTGPPAFAVFGAFPVLVAATGTAMRRWRAQERRDGELAAARATALERARIARELHDVVTHHVTAMVVQADAGRFLVEAAPERAAEGLAAISGTGRRALTELRALLDVLEATGESARGTTATPALDRLRDLAGQARRAGQPVELDERGTARPVPAEVELAAYRVVQEALTNAMKYATGRPTLLRVEHAPDRLDLEVRTAADDGTAPAPADPGRGGRGLDGLRERVRAGGGPFEAGADPDGDFRVHAAIPLPARA